MAAGLRGQARSLVIELDLSLLSEAAIMTLCAQAHALSPGAAPQLSLTNMYDVQITRSPTASPTCSTIHATAHLQLAWPCTYSSGAPSSILTPRQVARRPRGLLYSISMVAISSSLSSSSRFSRFVV